MIQGTTPDFTVYLNNKNIKFSDIQIVYVTIKQSEIEVTHNSDDDVVIDANKRCVTFSLSEEETFLFKEGEAELQVRVKYKNGNVFASSIKRFPVDRSLNKEVI